jgi:predicted TIM-barrel fold metal-dependent hydrolase
MIIDAHTHIGEISFPVGRSRISSMPEHTLLDAIEKYSIDFILVSSIEGAEFNSDRELMPADRQIPQLVSMQRVVDFVMKNRQRAKALLWVKPYSEERSSELDEFIRTNREFIAGLKIHPKLSNMEFRDKRMMPFIGMAGEYNLPVLVHTEDDGRSNVGFVEEVAKKYREINFIMAHMGMGSDNREAIGIIKRNPNIYGDIALAESGNVVRAINECGSDKIIFGSDAPVFGIDTYKNYLPVIDSIKSNFSGEEVDNVLYKNSMSLFRLNDIHGETV